MIAYIKGKITFKNPTFIIVETAGIGYHVNISLSTYAKIEKAEDIRILIHQHIKEDAHTLYGFADEAERSLFRLLISVSGVGPTTAQVALSGLSADELRGAIIAEDVNTFKRVKGIGPKTAKRIILDLKDKVLKDAGDAPLLIPTQDNTAREDALSALLALGYSRPQVQRSLNRLIRQADTSLSSEELIKLCLREMSA